MPDVRSLTEIMADPDDALWTVEETALVLRVERRTVSNLPGLIRTEMLGRGRLPMVRYLAADVRKYIRECRREAVA